VLLVLRTPIRPVRLKVLEGVDRGKELEFTGRTVVVGSSACCDLVLTDPTVSHRHASLEPLGEWLRARDLRSASGTTFLSARIMEMDVPLGATLGLGATRVALLPGDLPREGVSEKTELAGLVGHSPRMRRLFARMERVAPGEASVLIQGETGSGKEEVALGLHALSPRSAGPLVVFHCGAVQPSLAQSMLFGHVRGAFTDAHRDRDGAFEKAQGGTLFLDEVGELPLELQPLLLRALESRTFTRVGESTLQHADFRLIAATQCDLEAAVRRGAFREDLYHRLAAITLQVPPLRERPEDISPLAQHFATRAAGRAVTLDPSILASFQACPWPGNVRELRNAVERVLALGPGELPGFAEAPPWPDFHEARQRALESFERTYLSTMLERHGGSASAAAREAGIARGYFYRLLEQHGLRRVGRSKPRGVGEKR
jgi:DNA-binding NtrC family response regulator